MKLEQAKTVASEELKKVFAVFPKLCEGSWKQARIRLM